MVWVCGVGVWVWDVVAITAGSVTCQHEHVRPCDLKQPLSLCLDLKMGNRHGIQRKLCMFIFARCCFSLYVCVCVCVCVCV